MPIYTQTYGTAPEHSAHNWGSGRLEVLATPGLVAFMENAALNQTEPELEPEQTTVGTAIAIQHLAASKIGQPVTVIITDIQTDGRRREFSLEAYAEDKLIGTAKHTRVIVNTERFLANLNQD